MLRTTHVAQPHPQVWKVLFDRQLALLHRRACPAFGTGLAALGLSREAPPDLPALSARLRDATGWEIRPVPAALPGAEYFAALAQRQLPVVTRLRGFGEFDGYAAPDLFVDAFGRLPLLLEPAYADFLAGLGELATEAPAQRPALRRFFRATADYGVLQDDNGRLQVFGAALLTSAVHLHVALAAAKGDTAGPLPFVPVRDWSQLQQELAACRATVLPALRQAS